MVKEHVMRYHLIARQLHSHWLSDRPWVPCPVKRDTSAASSLICEESPSPRACRLSAKTAVLNDLVCLVRTGMVAVELVNGSIR